MKRTSCGRLVPHLWRDHRWTEVTCSDCLKTQKKP